MEIRRADPRDAAFIAAAMKAVADEGRWIATEADTTVEQLTERFLAGLEGGHVMLLAEHEGTVAGALGIHPSPARGVLSLGMFLLAEFRGRGWGRRLVAGAVEQARAVGARKLELEVFTDNASAISLYASMGFEVEGIRRDHYLRLDGSVRSALLMARFL